MNPDDRHGAPLRPHANLDLESGPRLFSVGKPMIQHSGHRKARQNRHPVLPSLIRHEVPEKRLHAEQFSEPSRLIHTIGAFGADVDLLKRDHVGIERTEDAGNPLQVHHAVESEAVLHIVGRDPKGSLGMQRSR